MCTVVASSTGCSGLAELIKRGIESYTEAADNIQLGRDFFRRRVSQGIDDYAPTNVVKIEIPLMWGSF